MIEVLYVDNHQLVLNKPAGLLTQPSGTDQDSLEILAKQWIKEQYHKPGEVFLHAIHRLDRPVSGIVLFARTSKSLSRLNSAMREKKSKKTYVAVVEGLFSSQTGTLEHFLVHDEHQARIVNATYPEAKIARLHYRVLSSHKNHTVIEIDLETGRYHQIRCQCAAIGHPIIGDQRYGSIVAYKDQAIMLHHTCLQVPHPITGDLQTFQAPVPADWSYV